jgi:hypothetical protein
VQKDGKVLGHLPVAREAVKSAETRVFSTKSSYSSTCTEGSHCYPPALSTLRRAARY